MTVDAETLRLSDEAARQWSAPDGAVLRPGSEAHKRAACQMFHDTFNPYKPSVIAWPRLAPDALQRLVNLPIWDIAVQTEGKARLRMATYASVEPDPDMRAAIELNAWEEGRHKEVLAHLVATYGIPLMAEPGYVVPTDPEWAYLVTGYSECIDSFFAFGLFELAKRSGFFPAELIDTFEPVMQEECRHILFFANWVAWHRRRLAWWWRVAFEVRVFRVWLFLIWERIGIARSMDGDGHQMAQDNNFTATGGKSVSGMDLSAGEMMALCLQENDRRFAGYDRRLLRPTTVPALARLACRVAGWWAGKHHPA